MQVNVLLKVPFYPTSLPYSLITSKNNVSISRILWSFSIWPPWPLDLSQRFPYSLRLIVLFGKYLLSVKLLVLAFHSIFHLSVVILYIICSWNKWHKEKFQTELLFLWDSLLTKICDALSWTAVRHSPMAFHNKIPPIFSTDY